MASLEGISQSEGQAQVLIVFSCADGLQHSINTLSKHTERLIGLQVAAMGACAISTVLCVHVAQLPTQHPCARPRYSNASAFPMQVGYWVGQGHEGKGLASTAVKALERIALQIGLHTMQIVVVTDNVRSIKVAESAAYVQQSRRHQTYLLHGVKVDEIVYHKQLG